MMKNTEENALQKPQLLFLNCLGSYFYSIVQSLNIDDEMNPLLYYLEESKLKYIKQDVKELQNKVGDNPWRYQPVMILNHEGREIDTGDRFLQFIKDAFNITINKIRLSENKILLNMIKEDYKKGIFSICKVDEFHIKHSHRFYMKKSNRHYLLIKAVDEENNECTVIDSEVNAVYKVGFDELEKAVYDNPFATKVYYRIDTRQCKKLINKENSNHLLQDDIGNMDYLLELIQEISKVKESDKEYCFKGYRYNILSKIIPFYELRKQVLVKTNYKELSSGVTKLLSEWKSLNVFMSYKILKKDYDLNAVQQKMENILKVKSDKQSKC